MAPVDLVALGQDALRGKGQHHRAPVVVLACGLKAAGECGLLRGEVDRREEGVAGGERQRRGHRAQHHVFALQAGGHRVGSAEQVHHVGVGAGRDVVEAQALKAHCGGIGRDGDRGRSLLAVAHAACRPGHEAALQVVVLALARLHQVGEVAGLAVVGLVVAGIHVERVGAAIGQVVEGELQVLALAWLEIERRLLIGDHAATGVAGAVGLDDEERGQHIAVVVACGLVGDRDLEGHLVVPHDAVLAGLCRLLCAQGRDGDLKIHGRLRLGLDGHRARGASHGMHSVLVGGHHDRLGAGAGGGEVEAHRLLLAGRHLGSDTARVGGEGGIESLAVDPQVEVAIVAVGTVVGQRHIDACRETHLLAAFHHDSLALEVGHRVASERGRVIGELGLDIVAVALQHGQPLGAVFLLAHGHEAVVAHQALAELLATACAQVAAKLHPVAQGAGSDLAIDRSGHDELHHVALQVVEGKTLFEFLLAALVIAEVHVDVVALVDREARALAVALPGGSSRVVVDADARGREQAARLRHDCGVGGRHRGVARLAQVGLDAHDGVLLHVVALAHAGAAYAAGIGIEHRELEVAVAHATPTPVDVEEVAHLKAVAHKGVTAARARRAVVHHGASRLELAVDEVVPVGLAVVVAVGDVQRGAVVAEVAREGNGDIIGIGTARVAPILHLHGIAGILHELGHSVDAGLVLGSSVAVAHVVPVEARHRQLLGGGGAIVVAAVAVGERVGGYDARRRLGPLVVVHHLGYAGGHTPGVGQLARAVAVHKLGAQVPVGRCLVPLAGDEGGNAVACGHWHPGGSAHAAARRGVVHHAQRLQLVLIVGEQGLHRRRQAARVDSALRAIGQHGCSAVVARHDGPALLTARGVEDIVAGVVGTRAVQAGASLHHFGFRCGGLLPLHESHRLLQCALLRHGTGHHRNREDDRQDEKESFAHSKK